MNINKKITFVLILYLFVALVTVGSNLLMTWRMDGEAAVINDAGRERMRSYHIALNLAEYIQHPSSDKRVAIHRDIGKRDALFCSPDAVKAIIGAIRRKPRVVDIGDAWISGCCRGPATLNSNGSHCSP